MAIKIKLKIFIAINWDLAYARVSCCRNGKRDYIATCFQTECVCVCVHVTTVCVQNCITERKLTVQIFPLEINWLTGVDGFENARKHWMH